MVKKMKVTDEGVEYVIGQLRMLADLVEAHRPDRFEVSVTRHTAETPMSSHIEREDAGIDSFAVLVQFDPGVFILPHAETR